MFLLFQGGNVYVFASTIKSAIQQFEGVDLVSSRMESVCDYHSTEMFFMVERKSINSTLLPSWGING